MELGILLTQPPECWNYRHTPEGPVLVFLAGTEVWTQDFTLARQVLYHFSHASSPFCFRLFFR
jgi:hypothetical protein